MRFSERVVLVTGGARGIGAGCCRVFAKEGAYVAVVDRDASAAETLARSLTGNHTALTGNHTAIVADVAVEDQIRAAVDRTIATYGRIDCVINNAGVHPPDTPLEKMAPEKVMDVLRVNFLSTYASHARLGFEFARSRSSPIAYRRSPTHRTNGRRRRDWPRLLVPGNRGQQLYHRPRPSRRRRRQLGLLNFNQ